MQESGKKEKENAIKLKLSSYLCLHLARGHDSGFQDVWFEAFTIVKPTLKSQREKESYALHMWVSVCWSDPRWV